MTMGGIRTTKTFLTLLSVLVFSLAVPPAISGQAWLPARGEGNFSITYQDIFIRDHTRPDGERFDVGHIRSSGLIQDLDYGLTDRVAVTVSLPYITAKYYGPRPHQLPIDNGDYHGTFQDFHVALRYNLRVRPLVVSPFIEQVVPSHHYAYFAHSAVGSDLKEFRIGTNLGRRLDPILPRAYFQTRYSYAIVQRALGIRPNRSRLDSELGYFLTKRVTVIGLESLQITHSGIDDTPDLLAHRLSDLFQDHDQISRYNFLNLGFGGAFAVSESVQFFASALTGVWGENGHLLNTGLAFGVNWNFRTRRIVRQAFASGTSGNEKL